MKKYVLLNTSTAVVGALVFCASSATADVISGFASFDGGPLLPAATYYPGGTLPYLFHVENPGPAPNSEAFFQYGTATEPVWTVNQPEEQYRNGLYDAFAETLVGQGHNEQMEWEINGKFNETSIEGTRSLFWAEMGYHADWPAGPSLAVEFLVDGDLVFEGAYAHPVHNEPMIWDPGVDKSGSNWTLRITTSGFIGTDPYLPQLQGGIGTYIPLGDGEPIPGPGIAMACAVGLAGIKRRRRRH